MNFINELTEVKHATKKQIKEEHWHVEGIIIPSTCQCSSLICFFVACLTSVNSLIKFIFLIQF